MFQSHPLRKYYNQNEGTSDYKNKIQRSKQTICTMGDASWAVFLRHEYDVL